MNIPRFLRVVAIAVVVMPTIFFQVSVSEAATWTNESITDFALYYGRYLEFKKKCTDHKSFDEINSKVKTNPTLKEFFTAMRTFTEKQINSYSSYLKVVRKQAKDELKCDQIYAGILDSHKKYVKTKKPSKPKKSKLTNQQIGYMGGLLAQVELFQTKCTDHETFEKVMTGMEKSQRLKNFMAETTIMDDRQTLALQRGAAGVAAMAEMATCDLLSPNMWKNFGEK